LADQPRLAPEMEGASQFKYAFRKWRSQFLAELCQSLETSVNMGANPGCQTAKNSLGAALCKWVCYRSLGGSLDVKKQKKTKNCIHSNGRAAGVCENRHAHFVQPPGAGAELLVGRGGIAWWFLNMEVILAL
jgi:hypothetical protein